jgi:hypothetical protein
MLLEYSPLDFTVLVLVVTRYTQGLFLKCRKESDTTTRVLYFVRTVPIAWTSLQPRMRNNVLLVVLYYSVLE